MVGVLDWILRLLLILIATLWLTGGTILHLSWGKIEFSSLDPWVLAFGALAWIRLRLSDRDFFLFRILSAASDLAFERIDAVKAKRRAYLLAAGLLFVLVLAHIGRHLSFETATYDHTCILQPLLNPFFGPLLKCDTCVGGSYLGEHLSFVFFLIAPITHFLKSTFFVFALQGASIGLGLWILLRFGPIRRRPDFWLVAVLMVFSLRGLRAGVVWDFREDVFAFVGFAIALVAYWNQRFWVFFIGLFLAILSKENMGLVVSALGLSIVWDRQNPISPRLRRLFGFVALGLGMVTTIAAFKFLIPFFASGHDSENNIVRRFPGLGATSGEVLKNLIFHPEALWNLAVGKLVSLGSLKYLALTLGPFAVLGSASFVGWLPALVLIGMNLLSDAPTQQSLQFHYELALTPFLIFALFHGMSLHPDWPRRRLGWVALFLALSTSGRWPVSQLTRFWPTLDEARASLCLSKMRFSGPVMMSPELSPQLAHLSEIRFLSFAVFEGPQGSDGLASLPIPATTLWRAQNNALLRMRSSTLETYKFFESDFNRTQAMVLDSQNSYERILAIGAQEIGFRPAGTCGDGRYQAFERDAEVKNQ